VQMPLQVAFRSMEHSEAIVVQVQRRTSDLERLFGRIISCHVVVELAGHHHRHGDRFRVAVHVGLPGHELIANRDPVVDRKPESTHVAVDRAFDEASRQLEDWMERRRGARHEEARGSS
jgi:putative sigma-54 modulation protein